MTYGETNLWKESSSCLLLAAQGLFRNFHMVKAYMKFQYCFLQSEHSILMKHFGTTQGSGILLISKQAHSCPEINPTQTSQTNKTQTETKKPPPQQQSKEVLQGRQM